MFGWLTRNDGRRGAQASRRLASPRASVFAEFALVMPIVMLVCSALIEITGYWDAQVMANHTAWTVGRIAMVRGSDGLPFWSAMHEKSKTGIVCTNMPAAIENLINDLNEGLHAADLFNNRGNVATLFLMSTCGIGYFGGTPGQDLSDTFNKIIDHGVSAIVDGIPEWIAEAVTNITIPDFIGGGGSGIEDFIREIVAKVINEFLGEMVLKPIAEWLRDMLKEAFERIFGEDGFKIDDFLGGDGGGQRFLRQMYGSASRIIRAKNATGKEVVTVTDMDKKSDGFFFAKNGGSYRGRLVYPEVADLEAKSDGYFVTGTHGWPPNDNGLAMTHVEVNWPYEYGWLFPVVSGGTGTSNGPVATGHSMVFPQPNILNENLYSEGATAFAPGTYTNNAASAIDELGKEMMQYLKFVKFCLKYRICEETVSLATGPWHWGDVYYWKYCPQLKELWPFDADDADSYAVGGDYGRCWTALTGTSDQSPAEDSIKDRFEPANCHSVEYFYWNDATPGQGEVHRRYGTSLVSMDGNAGLGRWYARRNGLAYNNPWAAKYELSRIAFNAVFLRCVKDTWLTEDERTFLVKKGSDVFYDSINTFADKNNVNVYNIVKWQVGHNLAMWKKQDAEVHSVVTNAEAAFAGIKTLIQKEIRDIEEIEAGTSQWTGDPDDPVLDPDDQQVIQDPEKAAEVARRKWAKLKDALRAKLKEIDDAAVVLRNRWEEYKKAANTFMSQRAECVKSYFAEGYIKTLAKQRQTAAPDGDSFSIPADAMPYDIGKGTREMLDISKRYLSALTNSWRLEVEYGAMLGLKSAGEAKREGKNPWDIVDPAEELHPDKPGSLSGGSDTGGIIDRDSQEYKDGKWVWTD